MNVAEFLLSLLTAYAAMGLLFAVPFAVRGVNRIDVAAQHAGASFRILIVPGTIVFWPLLLSRWMGAGK